MTICSCDEREYQGPGHDQGCALGDARILKNALAKYENHLLDIVASKSVSDYAKAGHAEILACLPKLRRQLLEAIKA